MKLILLAALLFGHANITTHNVPDGKCHEDMVCWDCKTMGNQICGQPINQNRLANWRVF